MLIEAGKGYWSLLQVYRRSPPGHRAQMLAGVLPVYAASEASPHIKARLERFIAAEEMKAA